VITFIPQPNADGFPQASDYHRPSSLGIGGTILGGLFGASISGLSGFRVEKKRQARQLESIKMGLTEESDESELVKEMLRAQEFFRDNHELLQIGENAGFY
jgi:hypothetical protein